MAAWAARNIRPQMISIDWLQKNVNEPHHQSLYEPQEEGDDFQRAARANYTDYPIMVIREPNETWIGDGNHRIIKAYHIDKAKQIPAYIIDSMQLPPPQQLR